MIGYIKGKIILIDDRDRRELVVEAGNTGIGYTVLVPLCSFDSLEVGDDVELHIYTQVREDSIELYGFKTRDERTLFTKLVTVNGVGSKSALAILNTLTPAELQTAILTDDAAALKKVPGIGPKVAKRLILELESVLKNFRFAELPNIASVHQKNTDAHADTRSALLNLGFADQDIARSLAELDNSEMMLSVEDEIRWVLKFLGK